jgi:FkbM family methyltransferase
MINIISEKIIKLVILLFVGFKQNQKLISNLIIWLHIQQGRNAPISNEMEVSFVSKFLAEADSNLILDVGAHKGEYTDQLLKKLPNSRIYLFEPTKNLFEYLVNKYERNQNIHVENYSLSDSHGTKTIYYNSENDSQATLTKREEPHRNKYFNKTEIIKSTKLSTFWKEELNNQRIDLLKLDIEGEEFVVLFDIKDNLQNINLIQFEIGEANIATKTFFKNFWELLTDSKFEIYRYTHFGKLLRIENYSEYEEFFRYSNYLAVNKGYRY